MHTLEQLRSGALAGARRLNLSAQLRSVPPQVFDLADTLEVLNLSGNQLASLPHDLPRLHRLKVLFCSDNPFTHLPEVLGDCASLQVVGFKACRIAEVRAQALPAQLRWLILTDNAITELPDALGQRPALQKLMLAGNRLRQLPQSLAQAHQLELLRLSANALEAVPPWLTALPRLSWLALAGNPIDWSAASPAMHPAPTLFTPHAAPHSQSTPLPALHWNDLQVDTLLGEGASGHIYRVHSAVHPQGLALKLFKGAVTSDGLPEHELAASIAAGQHPALNTPCAELAGHPQGARGVLLPLIAPSFINLAGPPSLESCTRDVYAPTLHMDVATAVEVARQIADAVAHLHQRGILHGDLYAHNILWNPATAQAVLSDFGAATLLPAAGNPVRRALQALEVRAFGCLLDELLALVRAGPATGAGPGAGQGTAPGANVALTGLRAITHACLLPQPSQRPEMAAVCAQLALIRT